MDGVVIRRASITDLDDLLQLNKSLFTFETLFNKEYNQEWTYSAVGKRYFKSRIESDNGIVLIVHKDEKAVGYVVGYINSYPFRNVNPIGEIENMFVEEPYRGQGIGKRLIASLKTIARQRGIKKLKVGALAQNSKAIDFYHETGFKDFELVLETSLE